MFDIAAGLRYEYGAFYLSGGYEFSTWFNMITAVRLQDQGFPLPGGLAPRQVLAVVHGDLGLEGWFVRGGWNF